MKACVNCEGSGDDCFDPEKNPALKREIKLARRAHGARQLHQARHPVRPAGLHGHRLRDLRHRLGFGGLSHRLRPELQQLRLADRRLPARGRDRRRLEPDRPHQRQGDEDAEGPRPVGEDRLRRLGLGRSRPALQHHDERLAHLPGVRRHPRVQSVLGIHVPRRHGLQSRLRQPAQFYDAADQARSTSSAYEHLCRLWTLVLEISVHDGAVPLQGDRRTLLRVPHARPRLRQYRRPPDDHGPALRLQGRPRARAARSPRS